MGLITTWVKEYKQIASQVLEGIAVPYIRYEESQKAYEIGYCSMDTDKQPALVYVYKTKIEHIDLSDLKGKVYLDLARDGYVRIYTTRLTEYLMWAVLECEAYTTACLVRVDNE